jgi:tRNA-specific 2-thiouridylase
MEKMSAKPTVAVALSGGIDSAMAAYRLRRDGFGVVGLHFITGYEPSGLRDEKDEIVTFSDGEARARKQLSPLCRELDINLHVLDLRKLFQREVVDYFIGSYADGLTPNPCMRCNAAIKFGAVGQFANQLGARYLATGHYARTSNGKGCRRLFKGVDAAKDQSYFLACLNQEQLSRAVFPLGALTKDQVRREARELGWQPLVKRESQDVCFVGDQKYGGFLAAQPGFYPQPGPIEDLNGRLLGRHPGLHGFTIGQRRGINCPALEPYYVIRLDARRNRLVVGRRDDLITGQCIVRSINWICREPVEPITVQVKVRYRHQAVGATVTPLEVGRARIDFERPIEAVTPGQGAVFYRSDEVLGGGWITDDNYEKTRV